jgi:hypothetical protein
MFFVILFNVKLSMHLIRLNVKLFFSRYLLLFHLVITIYWWILKCASETDSDSERWEMFARSPICLLYFLCPISNSNSNYANKYRKAGFHILIFAFVCIIFRFGLLGS